MRGLPEWVLDFAINLLAVVVISTYFGILVALFISTAPIFGFIWLAVGLAALMTWVGSV